MRRILLYAVLLTMALYSVCRAQERQRPYNFTTVRFMAEDRVPVYADLYNANGRGAPLILLYHQAGFSRGSFRNIAPMLVELGFNVLAVDLRAGGTVNMVKNLTHESAIRMGTSTQFTDVIPDLEAAFHYGKKKLKAKKIIYWGSSYSASLGFYMVAKHPDDYTALLAYSPGEYFSIDNRPISYYAEKVKIPTFIASAADEKNKWIDIYDAISYDKGFYIPPTGGHHGTVALAPTYKGSSANWAAVIPFLKKIRDL